MNPDRPVSKLRALGALVVLLAVVVGAPAAVLLVFGWPFTKGFLDVRGWPHALTATELSDDAIQRIIVAVALVLLAYLLGCVVSEVVALVRRVDRSTRYHNPLSQWVRNLVAVSAVLLSTARTVPSFAAVPAPPPAATAAPAPTTGPPAATTTLGRLGGATGLPAPDRGLVVTAQGEVADARDHVPGTSVVDAGRRDTLYSIAVRHLGDGNRRDELLELNRGRVMPDGTVFDGTVRPGDPILVPTSVGAATPTATADAAPAAPVTAAAVTAAPRTYVVQPGDSLWAIAEAHLGDGARYAEIHEANLGREVEPGVAYLSTTEVIRPGWELVLPPVERPAAVGAAASPDAPAADTGGTHVVERGESVWSIAEDEVARVDGDAAPPAVADYVARTVDANADRFVRPGHPELIMPGQELELPTVHADAAPPPVAETLAAPTPAPEPAPAPAAETPAAAPLPAPSTPAPPPPPAPAAPEVVTPAAPSTALPAPAPPVTAPAPASVDAADERDLHLSLPGLLGATVAVTGALGVLVRLRHQRLNRRRPGHRVQGPPADVALVERALRAQADAELCRWAPRALRHLAPRLDVEWDGSYPMIASATLGDDALSVTWTAPRPSVIEPWRAVDSDGLVWELPRSAPEAEVSEGVVPPCPGLVTVGRGALAPMLVDLEAAAFVSVAGPPARTADFARALALELAVSDFADLLDIRLVGLPADGFEHLHRVHAVNTLAQALAWARPVRAGTDELLADNGVDSLFELRARQGATAVTHEPLVLVVAPSAADPAGLVELRELCAPGRGVVAVVLGNVDATAMITLHDDGRADVRWAEAALEPVVAAGVPAASLERVAALLDHAADAEEHAVPITLPTRRDEPFAEPPFAVEVRLLGPVTVGPAGGPDWDDLQPKALELVAWLATHPGVHAGERVRAELWPVRDVTDRSLNSLVSQARTRLGGDTDGSMLFPLATDDRYRLIDAVVTDVARLERRLRWAATAADSAAIGVLHEGLALVRGRPFTARTGFDWAYADQLAFQAEQLVVDAAHRLGELSLAADDPNGAVWATAAGLRGRPGDEALYQLRMRAFAAMGNRASLRLAMNELCTQLQDLAGVDEPSEETTELFEQLMGRERSA